MTVEDLIKNVLIAEDDKLASTSLAQALADVTTIRTTTAADGVEAFEKAEQNPPDLLVTDIHMPNMDGLELVEKIRNTDWGKDIPVIIMTNDNTTTTLYSALKGGVSVYLSKTSLDVDGFAQQIKQALDLV